MINGVGIDIVDIDRFELSLEQTPGLVSKLFTKAESTNSIQSMAGRFAAKEALIKALNGGYEFSWHEAEVVNLEGGKPAFVFYGEAAKILDCANVHLSISHVSGIAAAIVIVEH